MGAVGITGATSTLPKPMDWIGRSIIDHKAVPVVSAVDVSRPFSVMGIGAVPANPIASWRSEPTKAFATTALPKINTVGITGATSTLPKPMDWIGRSIIDHKAVPVVSTPIVARDMPGLSASPPAGAVWRFAEQLGNWAENLGDPDTRAVLLNLGGILIGLAGTAVAWSEGGGGPLVVAALWTAFYVMAMANAVIDKLRG